MAFKKIESGFSQGFKLGGKKGEVKSVTGFLLGVKTIRSTFKERGKSKERVSYLYQMADPKTGNFEVWGNGALNFALLTDDAKPKLKSMFINKLCRFTFAGMLKAKPGQTAGRKIDVEVDNDAKMPKGAGRIQF